VRGPKTEAVEAAVAALTAALFAPELAELVLAPRLVSTNERV
jgi:hypothetical protein